MTTQTMVPSQNIMNRDIGRILADVYHRERALQINIRFIEAGRAFHRQSESFNHPAPIFTRLFLFRKGSAELKTRRVTQKLTPGKIYLLPPGLPFRVNYHKTDLTFFHLKIEDYLGISIFNNTQKIMQTTDRNLFNRICEAYDSRRMLKLKSSIFEAVGDFVEPTLDELSQRHDATQYFAAMINHIQNTPPGKIQIDELAEVMNMSRAALSKSFSRKIGMSIKAYLQNYLLQKAQEMLLFSDMTVTQITAALGLSSSQYFHRLFKTRTGMTPKAYRESHPRM